MTSENSNLQTSAKAQYTEIQNVADIPVKAFRRNDFIQKRKNGGKNKKFVPQLTSVDEKQELKTGVRKTFRTLKRSERFILENQIGESLKKYCFSALSGVADGWISTLEDIALTCVALSEAQSMRQTISILMLYVKTNMAHSACGYIQAFFETLLAPCVMDNQVGADLCDPEWLSGLRDLSRNWQKVTTSKFFCQLSQLLGAICALGLCKASNLNVTLGGLQIFSGVHQDKHKGAIDMFAALVSTTMYFIEGGYRCFQLKSLQPFLLNDDEATQFDEEYFALMELSPLMKAGNMERVRNVSENDLDFRLNKAIEQADTLYRVCQGTFEKKVLHEKLLQLRKMRIEFLTIRADGGLRERPYAYYVKGPSGVGKSSISAIMMRTILMANGHDASDERIVNLNEDDAYMSNYRSYVNGVYCDDLGNTQAQYLDKSPMSKMIDLVNNVKNYAVMAELELKGKVTLEPKCVGSTSNLDLISLASHFSNEPFSIVSRFNVQVDVAVKKEFSHTDGRLDQTKVFAAFPEGVPPVPDLWDLRVYSPMDGTGNWHKRVEIMGIKTLPQLLQFVSSESRKHTFNQKNFLSSVKNLDIKLRLCDQCKVPQSICACNLCNQLGGIDTVQEYVVQWYDSLILAFPWWISSNFFINFAIFWSYRFYICYFRNIVMVIACLLIGGCYSVHVQRLLVFFLFIASGILFVLFHRRRMEYVRVIARQRGHMVRLFRTQRTQLALIICANSAVLLVIYKFFKQMRHVQDVCQLNNQGSLDPQSVEDIRQRDSEVNPWKTIERSRIVSISPASTVATHDMEKIVAGNTVYISFDGKNGNRLCMNGLFIKSNFLLLPRHFLGETSGLVKLSCRREKGENGVTFDVLFDRTVVVEHPTDDLLIVYVTGSPSFKDLVKYLHVGTGFSGEVRLLHRNIDGVIIGRNSRSMFGEIQNQECKSKGFMYHLQDSTFKGLCGAALISMSVSKGLLGIHVGGKYSIGGAVWISQDFIRESITLLEKRPGVISLPSAGTLLSNQYGIDIAVSNEIHPKSPLNFLQDGANVEFLCSTIGRSTPHSKVEPTEISLIVEEVCGQGNIWGKPKFGPPYWKPWQETLVYLVDPVLGFERKNLEWAVLDYSIPLLQKIRESNFDWLRPLNDDETVCGIDSLRFIDAMRMSTSLGFPLSGPKDRFILEVGESETHQCLRKLDQRFWDEFERMKCVYRQGERAYPIFKASLKDEPTKLSKDKVRVFEAAPIALQLGIRKYFLPIARFLSLHSVLTECAVGVNAHGPEWHELATHMTKFGENRILAGDYSKYDLRLSQQITIAVFDVLISLARESGNYSEDDLLIMKGIAADVVNPLVAYNGDLIMLFGSNPSGQNITVYLNSLANSLIVRCGFYSIVWPQVWYSLPKFRDVAAIMTYGDDLKGSVKKGYDFFNHVTLANWLKERGVVFTMPDKESVPVPYMCDSDADFLKRKNRFDDDLNMYVGMLDEMSIYKSLHAVLKSKAVTNREQCMDNIEGAMREWFFYGKEKYEEMRGKMCLVAEKAHMVIPFLDTSYDDLMVQHREKYKI